MKSIRKPPGQGPHVQLVLGYYPPQNAIALQDSLNSFYNNSTHWWKQNYQVAKVLNANLQASGGNENVRYMIGAGYYDEEGIAVNTGFTRFNVLTNLDGHGQAKKLRMDRPFSLTYSEPEIVEAMPEAMPARWKALLPTRRIRRRCFPVAGRWGG